MTAAIWMSAGTEGPRGGALAGKLPVAPGEGVGASGRDGSVVGRPEGVSGVGGRASVVGRLAVARGLLAEYEAGVGLRRGGRRFATGLGALDRALGGGLLRGTLCEVAAAGMGLGAMSLALALARAAAGPDARPGPEIAEPLVMPELPVAPGGRREEIPWEVGSRWESRSIGSTRRRVFLIDPEGAFYPPAAVGLGVPLSRLVIVRPGGRRDAVWAMEQALRCGSVGAVVGLLDSLSVRAARQLQLAAEAGGGIGLLVGREGRSVGVKFAAVRMVVEASGFAGVGGVPPVRTGGQAASGTRRTASNRSLTVAAQINGAGKDSLKGGTEIGISAQRRLVWVRLSRARPGVSMDVFMLELGDAAGDVCLPAVSGDRSGEGSGTPGRRWVAG